MFYKLLQVLTIAALLTACGGNADPEPDERVPTPGVDCTANPGLCR